MDTGIMIRVFAVACVVLATASGHRVVEKYNVTIEPISSTYQTLDSGRRNFTFACSVSGPNGTVNNSAIILSIPGGDKKLAKVTNRTINGSILFAYNVTSYTDDETVFVCQYNQGNQTLSSPNLTLTVFYAPLFLYPNMTKFNGDNGTYQTVTVGLKANPPVQDNFTWWMNGRNLSNSTTVTLQPGGLFFTPILVNATGNYSVTDCNNISCTTFTFPFTAYYAPVFAGNLTNASLLTEIATGSNRNLTCTVVGYQGPSALSLNVTMEPNATPNWKYHRNNASSITVPITNASQSDVAAYVCHACCGQETKYCSYLEFDTYVGGPPSPSNLTISCSQTTVDMQFNISCNVTDRNLAPVTMLQFSMPGLNLNASFTFGTDDVPINKTFYSLFTDSLESIARGNYSLHVEASNQLGSNVLVFTEYFFFDGLNISVTIQPNNSAYQTLGLGKNFTFTCAVSESNATVQDPKITLVIPGSNSKEKLAKVTKKTVKTGAVFTYPITEYTDDQTVFVCQYIHDKHTLSSSNLILTVFYSPQFTNANITQVHGDNGTNVNVSVGLVANPPIIANYTWTMNERNLSNSSNVKVMPGELRFVPLLVSSTGNYSVHECNNISCNDLHFPLVVYYAPLFTGNSRNVSLLTEIAPGHNKSLTCTVVDWSGPDPLNLTLTNDIPDSKHHRNNASSITITITNASQSDAIVYSFTACCGNQPQYCSYLNFSTFVGGPPNNSNFSNLHVSVSGATNGNYNLTIVGNFTDNSQAPVTQIKYAISQTGLSRNVSVEAPLKGKTQKIQSNEIVKASDLGGESYVNVDFYAVNDIGSVSLTMVRATLPLVPSSASPSPTPTNPSPAKNNAGKIAVAVLVPLTFVIFLIAAAVGGYIYYKKHKHPKGFRRLVPHNDDSNDVTDGVYDAT